MGSIETPAARSSALSSHTEDPLAPDQGPCVRSSVSVYRGHPTIQNCVKNTKVQLKIKAMFLKQAFDLFFGCFKHAGLDLKMPVRALRQRTSKCPWWDVAS